ncbi:hypothetical protein [Sporosarcina sp. FSL K6-1508]|uniref:hypothetical protein n=1 Tax=Sporosarcina sp. FSL K6-1508 TaxID=2921553 RepID=UPI0030FA26B6
MNETNAERLERFKSNWQGGSPNLQPADVDWFIEQAERAQELEKELYKTKALPMLMELEKRKYENNRLREALEFYAKEENYNVNTTNQWEPLILINQDHGEKARQALEGKRDG